jgi:hypothetical protein
MGVKILRCYALITLFDDVVSTVEINALSCRHNNNNNNNNKINTSLLMLHYLHISKHLLLQTDGSIASVLNDDL